jgi:hypothetical protein
VEDGAVAGEIDGVTDKTRGIELLKHRSKVRINAHTFPCISGFGDAMFCQRFRVCSMLERRQGSYCVAYDGWDSRNERGKGKEGSAELHGGLESQSLNRTCVFGFSGQSFYSWSRPTVTRNTSIIRPGTFDKYLGSRHE